jgi:Cu/Ag efflux protein CusF
MILVRHEAVAALGMQAMELMAITGDPAVIDGAGVRTGDQVRVAVRPRGNEILLIQIRRLP